MSKIKPTLSFTMIACLLISLTMVGCGKQDKVDNVSEETTQHNNIMGDVLNTGGNFNKIVVVSKSENDPDVNTNQDTEQPTDTQKPEEMEPVETNPALRPNIGLASMNLADLVGGLNVSDNVSDKADKFLITLDGYTRYVIQYTDGYTVNDFDKDIRYFCWSIPDNVTPAFINALGEICKEHGYLHDGLCVSNTGYHTEKYEHYVYQIENKDHKIMLAINHSDTSEVYYTVEDK